MKSVRILIADDHEIVRRGLRSLLASRSEWKVCGEAQDGLDAIEKAKKALPDIVLMDVSMPRMNGLEAARILRKEVPSCEILIVSQNDPSIMKRQALEAGAFGYVSKADLSRDLLVTLDQIIEEQPGIGTETGESGAPAKAPAANEYFLQGGGELGALMRAKDWAFTRLGPAQKWQQSLKTSVSICLKSRFDLLIWWGPDLVVLYNDPYSRTLAAKHPAALGKPGREVWGEIWDVIGPMLERVMKTGEATWSDDLLLLLQRHGYAEETYHTFSYTPIPDDSGGIGGVFTPVTETTEQVISERRLRTLRDLGAQSVDAKNEPQAWSIAADVLSSNPYDIPFAVLYQWHDGERRATAETYAGISAGHPLCPAVVSLDGDTNALSRLIRQVVNTGKAAEVHNADEMGLEYPGGVWGISPRELVALPLAQAGQSHPLGVLVAGVNPRKLLDESYRTFFNLASGQIAKSIADARAYEQERKRAEALAELDRAKTAFFSNVSHEFRTPLTLMLGPVEELIHSAEERGKQHDKEQLAIIHRNSLRLLKLVNSLLDFSRIEAGRVQAVYVPTDLAKITGELASIFHSAMEKAGLKFHVDCRPLPEAIYVDSDMWEKIVLNLLSNAFKYTFSGEISLSLKMVNGAAQLEVKDTGTGISETELPRLFERFHRVEGARGRTHEGTGIGLALVQELVRLHGGQVKVTSRMGEGSTFQVSIPQGKAHLPQDRVDGVRSIASTALRADSYVDEVLRWLPQDSGAEDGESLETASPASAEPQEPVAQRDEGQRPLIVLADDNADMRQYVRRLLKDEYRVHAVSNGEEALAAVLKMNPDLVLTDVMMPGMDGFELLRSIRENEATRLKPVILLSARAGEESRFEGLHAGADDYLVKPFTARELLARIGAHLKMARIRQQASALERVLRAEAEMERSRLRDLLMQAPSAIGITSGPEHRWVFVNQARLKMAGRSHVDEFLGKTVRETYPELEGTPLFGYMDQVYRTGLPYIGREVQAVFERGPGGRPEIAYVNFVYQPMRNLAGQVEGLMIHTVEVTEQVLAREALQRAHDELEQRILERTDELAQAERDLRQLSGHLLHAQDEERRRIARELHDSAGQILSALNLNLVPVQRRLSSMTSDMEKPVAQSIGLVDQLSTELRTLSHLLHPPLLDEAGLASAARWYVEGFAERSHIPVDLEVNLGSDRLGSEMETTIFRIVQECLTNIHRHSGSATAAIRLVRNGDVIEVEISDRGRGMPAPKAGSAGAMRAGVGIQGMRERVRQLGGEFQVKSSPRGTHVIARLPAGTAARQPEHLASA